MSDLRETLERIIVGPLNAAQYVPVKNIQQAGFDETKRLITLALTQLDDIERDREAMEKLRGYTTVARRWHWVEGESLHLLVSGSHIDPADAILGKKGATNGD